MKVLQGIKIAVLLPAALLVVSGCYTPPQAVDTSLRFQEGAFANVVLEFYKWDNFFITRPNCREDGFLRPLRRDDLGNTFDTLHVGRDMAVVVVGWNYNPNDLALIVENWKSILRSHGFRRVVCLRANYINELDGMVIIDDWNQSVDKPKQTARL